MAFDPEFPPHGAEAVSAEFRAQFNALNDKIDTTLPGPPGPEGPQGTPGEVSTQQLADAMAQATYEATVTSSANTNGVAVLEIAISDPPTQAEVQALMDKLNEFINAARR